MIEVNLLPGAVRRKRRAAPSLSLNLAGLGALRSVDRLLAAAVAAWIVAPLLVLWLFLGTRAEKVDLELRLEEARQDSASLAAVIATTSRLQARRDTIAQKLVIIQEVDAGRFIWAHILDEIARAIPRQTWLTSLAQTDQEKLPRLKLDGRTGSTFALTEFMKSLEESSFLKNVRLVSTELVRENDRLLHAFVLELAYEEPGPDVIETVPLFVGIEEE